VYVGDLDLESVVNLGETYGELDMEGLVQLDPDLFVNDMWANPPDIWGLDEDARAQLAAITPVVQISHVNQPVTETLASLETRAGLLGADLSDPEIVADKAAFEQASAELKAAIAEKPRLKVLVMSGLPEDNMYVSSPRQSADLIYFQELGLDMVGPENITENNLWEQLSWEQAGKYPVDLFLIDSRRWSATGEQLVESVPTFAALPAVKAGQFGSWDMEYVPSYKGFTPVLQRLAEVIRNADPDIVP
jgi:iron complex transport system substrate-binding protein